MATTPIAAHVSFLFGTTHPYSLKNDTYGMTDGEALLR